MTWTGWQPIGLSMAVTFGRTSKTTTFFGRLSFILSPTFYFLSFSFLSFFSLFTVSYSFLLVCSLTYVSLSRTHSHTHSHPEGIATTSATA